MRLLQASLLVFTAWTIHADDPSALRGASSRQARTLQEEGELSLEERFQYTDTSNFDEAFLQADPYMYDSRVQTDVQGGSLGGGSRGGGATATVTVEAMSGSMSMSDCDPECDDGVNDRIQARFAITRDGEMMPARFRDPERGRSRVDRLEERFGPLMGFGGASGMEIRDMVAEGRGSRTGPRNGGERGSTQGIVRTGSARDGSNRNGENRFRVGQDRNVDDLDTTGLDANSTSTTSQEDDTGTTPGSSRSNFVDLDAKCGDVDPAEPACTYNVFGQPGRWVCRNSLNAVTGLVQSRSECVNPSRGSSNDVCGCCGGECPTDAPQVACTCDCSNSRGAQGTRIGVAASSTMQGGTNMVAFSTCGDGNVAFTGLVGQMAELAQQCANECALVVDP